ncbi:hypothetical protein HF563_14580 [Acidithiobacillus ferridurans]|nr:hypothetical protein [Acidithiobacillus ferridurans]
MNTNANRNGLAALKKSSTELAGRLGELERKVTGGGRVKPIRVRGAEPAVDRLARDIHRISVEVDILEGQILGGHGGAI